MHPHSCQCGGCHRAAPLTPDEQFRLALFLAKRGHPEAGIVVLSRVAYDAMIGTLEGNG